MLEPNRQGEVWVFAEQEDGSLHDVALELCGKARDLADRLGVSTGAVLPGAGVGPLAKRLIAQGIDNVYLADHPRLSHYQTLPVRPGARLAGREAPAADRPRRGHAHGPRPGAARGLVAAFGHDGRLHRPGHQRRGRPQDQDAHKNLLLQIRPAFGGNIIATIVNYDQWPQMATVREGVMADAGRQNGRTGQVIEEKWRSTTPRWP